MSTRLTLLVDDAVPYARQAFAPLGDVHLLPGRAIDTAAVKAADAMVIRSRTRVNEALLAGSRVRFVASTVVGLDHVDQDYLRDAGIGFYSAQGCNANSVAEYVITALLVLAQRRGWTLAGRRLAVIGVGNVGRRVAAKARGLGLQVLESDPPRAEREPGFHSTPLDACLQADIITLHTPLTDAGPHPSRNLLDAERLQALQPHAVVVNAARGGILDEDALLQQPLGGRIIDCWQNEPDIDTRLLRAGDIVTPHIAGHSLDAKVNGTRMAHAALCRAFDVAHTLDLEPLLPVPTPTVIELNAAGKTDEEILHAAVCGCYPLWRDDADLRREGAAGFEALRRQYPVRREWPHHRIRLRNAPANLTAKLEALGFLVEAL